MASRLNSFLVKPNAPSAVDGIVERFRSMIETGQLRVGDDLPAERDLAEQLGVGRNTVREAIRRLEAYGIVETKQKRGARVVDKSVDAMINILSFRFENDIGTFRDIQRFREIVETGLAADVVERASLAEIAAFRKLNGRFASTRNADALSELDLQFHQLFIKAARNQTASKIYDVLSGPILQIMRLGKSRDGGETAMVGHEAILTALEARDVAGLKQAISRHLGDGARYLREKAEERGAPSLTVARSAGDDGEVDAGAAARGLPEGIKASRNGARRKAAP
jgi:GntR family transcriptional regulator, transcriptional repressor for pyruvate dehydrogenase complex